MDKSQGNRSHEPEAGPGKGPDEDVMGSKCKTEKEEPLSYEEGINKAAGIGWRFPLIEMEGVPLRNHIVWKWSSIWAFRPDPSDLLIATYPKAGKSIQQVLASALYQLH